MSRSTPSALQVLPVAAAVALLLSTAAAVAQAAPVQDAATTVAADTASAAVDGDTVADAQSGGKRRNALDRVTISAARKKLEGASTKLPLTARETPQSVSSIDAERLENETLISINDVMQTITGVNVSFYDTQRPLYFARGFQITDFQVDGIPTYSGGTNQEYDTVFYSRIDVVRGANGLTMIEANHVVLVDLPGHGESALPDPFSLEAAATSIAGSVPSIVSSSRACSSDLNSGWLSNGVSSNPGSSFCSLTQNTM